MSSHGYLTALERERDELERELRRMRAIMFVAVGFAGTLSLAIVVVWALARFTEALS